MKEFSANVNKRHFIGETFKVQNKRIVLIVGVRPEFIKSAILAKLFAEERGIDFQIWNTGQHYDYNLSSVFTEKLDIEISWETKIGSGSQSEQIAQVMTQIEMKLTEFKPHLVIIIGDTSTSLGATLAAVKLNIPVAHIEAGPRETFIKDGKRFRDVRMLSMPEEVNRILIDHCSTLLFAPTELSAKILKREGILGRICMTGDVNYDIVLRELPYVGNVALPYELEKPIREGFNLMTLHRVENTEDRYRLLQIIAGIANTQSNVIFPMHPRTRNKLKQLGFLDRLSSIPHVYITEPLGYREFLKLLKMTRKVFTDSGGVQREAFLLGKPCIILQEHTGWVDLTKYGMKCIDLDNLLEEMNSEGKFKKPRKNPFGDGHASERIVEIIKEFLEA
jgi:UDP-N-acetylglucosamine 2-epimerase